MPQGRMCGDSRVEIGFSLFSRLKKRLHYKREQTMTDFTGPMMAAFQEALADLPGGATGPLKSLRETLGQWAQEVETLPALGQVLDIDDLPVEARRRRFNAAM